MKPEFNHEGSGLKRMLAGIGITMGVVLLSFVSTFSQDYPSGKLWVTFWPGAFDSLETDTSGHRVYEITYLDSVNAANECSTIVSDSVAGLDSTRYDYMVYFPDTSDLLDMADAYLSDSSVRNASPDYYIEFLYTPNDVLFNRQGSTVECHQWNLDSSHCQFEKAWDITKGDTSVVIAMTDIGIFYSHPEIKGNLWFNGPEDYRNPGTFEPWPSGALRDGKYGDFDGVDQDGNGFTDDIVGWNFVSGDSTPYIDSVGGAGASGGHGTMTSSVASAVTNNQYGIAGAGYNCRLMLVTGIPTGSGSQSNDSWGVKAIRYATLMGADVINMSWRSLNPAEDGRLADALRDAYYQGVVLVAAAGNSGVDTAIYPAADWRVLSVAGTDLGDYKDGLSTYDETVDLSAPIKAWGAHFKPPFSAHIPGFKYTYNSYPNPPGGGEGCNLDDYDTLGGLPRGTSISAPLVAGAAALVRSVYPSMSNDAIYEKLINSTDPIRFQTPQDSQTWNGKVGSGRLNAFKAVTYFGNIPSGSASSATLSGTVYVSGDITVPQGKTLTLAAGTKLKFVPGDVMGSSGNPSPNKAQIIVKGTLNCLGTLTDSIILSSFQSSPQAGDWGGILVAHPGRANIAFTRFSYADTAISVRGDTATVRVRNSTFNYFDKAAVYSVNAKTNLGGSPGELPQPDCGLNNILMKTSTSGAKAVIKFTGGSGTLLAEGNWYDSTSPPASWFVGNVDYSPYLPSAATPTSCEDGYPKAVAVNHPLEFELSQNYPNPFNPATTIRYALPQAAKVELRIFNILGQVVRKLVDEEKPAGIHQAVWDGKDETGRAVSTGVYLYQIKAGDYVKAMKMSFIK